MAFIVGKYRVETSGEKLLSLMFDERSNLKEEVFLEENIDQEISSEAHGEAAIKSYKPNEIIIEASSSGRAILILSEPFYLGWKAFVDNSPTKIYRANYAFRGVVIPEGMHQVRLSYEPDSFKTGILLSAIGATGTVILVSFLFFWSAKRTKSSLAHKSS